MGRYGAAALGVALGLWADSELAQAQLFGPAEFRHSTSVRFRTNRIGIGAFNDTGVRAQLYPKSESMFLKGCYIEGGVVTQLSPAAIHPGLYVQAVPIAPLLLRASMQRLVFFGLFGAVVEYPDVDADWSSDVLSESQSRAQFGGGWFAEGMATLRLKVGPIVAMHEQRLGWLFVDRDNVGADKAWYEPVTDLLMAQEDYLHTMKTTVGALITGHIDHSFWLAGAHWERYSVARSAQLRDILGAVVMTRPVESWVGGSVFGLLGGVLLTDQHRQYEPYIGGFWTITFSSKEG